MLVLAVTLCLLVLTFGHSATFRRLSLPWRAWTRGSASSIDSQSAPSIDSQSAPTNVADPISSSWTSTAIPRSSASGLRQRRKDRQVAQTRAAPAPAPKTGEKKFSDAQREMDMLTAREFALQQSLNALGPQRWKSSWQREGELEDVRQRRQKVGQRLAESEKLSTGYLPAVDALFGCTSRIEA